MLFDLRNLYLPSNNELVNETIEMILQNDKAADGDIRLRPGTNQHSDVCVNGMFLNYASYFNSPEKKLQYILDSILAELMPDGGFNCRTIRSGTTHGSLHSTISVLKGFVKFQKAGFTYRKKKISKAVKTGIEFILIHRLFLSVRTGKLIDKNFLKLTYPCRWWYDILRAMNYFHYAGIK